MRSLVAFARSDLYRAWRTHFLWLTPAFLVAIVTLSTVLLALAAYGPLAEAISPDDPLILRHAIEGSPVAFAASLAFDSDLLPLATGYAAVSLVAGDWKAQTMKTLLTGGASRKAYLASKVLVCATFSLALPLVMLAASALAPLALGLTFTKASSGVEVATWLALAFVSGLAYALLELAVACLAKNETFAWVAACVVGFGIVGSMVAFPVNLVVGLGILPAHVGSALLSLLPSTQTALCALGGNGLLALPSADLAHLVLVCAVWGAAAIALAYALLRRRSL